MNTDKPDMSAQTQSITDRRIQIQYAAEARAFTEFLLSAFPISGLPQLVLPARKQGV